MVRSNSNTTTKVSPARSVWKNIPVKLTDRVDCAAASAYVVELEGKNSLVSVGMCFDANPSTSNLLTVYPCHRWGSFARNEIVGRALAQDGENAQPLRDLGAIDVWESGTDRLVGKAFDPRKNY